MIVAETCKSLDNDDGKRIVTNIRILREQFEPAAVAKEMSDTHFLCTSASAAAPSVIYVAPDGLRRGGGLPVGASFQSRVSILVTADPLLPTRLDDSIGP